MPSHASKDKIVSSVRWIFMHSFSSHRCHRHLSRRLRSATLTHIMSSQTNLPDLRFQSLHHLHHDSPLLQPFPSLILPNKRLWLPDPYIHRLDRPIEPQYSLHACSIAAQPLVAWFHRCVEHCIRGKDFADALLGQIVLLSYFDETALFRVRATCAFKDD